MNSSSIRNIQIKNIDSFNPLNLSQNDFIVAGKAWLDCRKFICDANLFGIGCDPKTYNLKTLHGLWFVRGNLLRDFASLNKVETVPFLVRICNNLNWNSWRLVSAQDDELTKADWSLLDKIAEFTIDVDRSFNDIINAYQLYSDLKVPKEIVERF